MIKTINCKFEEQKFFLLALHDAKVSMCSLCQGNMSCDDCLECFQNLLDVNHVCDSVTCDNALVTCIAKKIHGANINVTCTSNDQCSDLRAKANDQAQAVVFLTNADKHCAWTLLEDLENLFTHGVDQCPADLVKACQMLKECKKFKPSNASTEMEAAFTQKGKNK